MSPGPDGADHPPRILIVDDERQYRELLEVMLAPEGFSFLHAASGDEALDAVTHLHPDLVLLDVVMPGMDGYEVTRAIKGSRFTKNIPVIMLTVLGDRNARMLGLSAGVEDFVTKPVDRAELCVRVRNLLRLKAYSDYQATASERLEREMATRSSALIQSERLYRGAFEATPVGIVIIGLDGHWLQVNRQLADLLGYTREELQSMTVHQLVPPEDVAGDAALFSQMLAGTLPRHVMAARRYRRRDGQYLWARVTAAVDFDAIGQPRHIVAVVEATEEPGTSGGG